MVQMTPKNENKGNKRKSSLANDDNQNSPKFRKSQSFANRTPFKGNQSPANKGNQGSNKKQFNKNKSPFNKAGNKNKPEQSKNEDVSDSSEEELDITNILTSINDSINNPTRDSDDESSSDENDVVNQSSNMQQNDSEESESEEEIEVGELNESSEDNNSKTNPTADDSEESGSEEEEKVVSTLSLGTNEMETGDAESSESEEDNESSKTENPSNKNNSKHALTQAQSDRTICIRNMPSSVKGNQLQSFFGRYGMVEQVRTNSTAAFITFHKRGSAAKALEVNGMEYQNHYVLVTMHLKGSSDNRDLPHGVFVGSIPHDMLNINSLSALFSECGTVVDISIFQRQKHYAYVWFDSSDAVQLALAMNNKVVGQKDSRAIIVDKINNETILDAQKKKHLRQKDRIRTA